MKAVGVLLLLWGGGFVRQTLIRRRRDLIAWGEELCRLLDTLEKGIAVYRRPLPDLLEQCRGECRLLDPFLGEVLAGLQARRGFARVWREACGHIPDGYRPLMIPLGDSLTEGERKDLLILTREEVHRLATEERRRLGERSRLITAVCFSAALLVAVVLI